MDASGRFLVVVGVDGSEQSLAALRWAVDEARLRHGSVRAVTAWHYPPVPSTVEDSVSNDSPFTPLSVSRLTL
jgi:nucleotide-binding universal stress UspA family protein